MQAARVAKRLQQEFGIEVELKDGSFGHAEVFLNGEIVAKTGISGWLPRTSVIIRRIRSRLSGANASAAASD